MKAKNLIIPALAVAAYFVYTQKKAIGLLNYYIKNVGLSFDGLTPLLLLNIGIQNPSNAQFVVNDFVGNISANGFNVGTIYSFRKLIVPPASQVVYPVIVRMNLISIVSDIINLIQSGSGISQTIVLTGVVNASGIVAPVTLNYKIG
jgi:LEA14-like dessication related protein